MKNYKCPNPDCGYHRLAREVAKGAAKGGGIVAATALFPPAGALIAAVTIGQAFLESMDDEIICPKCNKKYKKE